MITKDIKEFARNIPIPHGFTKDIKIEKESWGKNPEEFLKIVLENTVDKIRYEMEVYPTEEGDNYQRETYGTFIVNGHTHFEVEGRGWLTFDRTGVEDSFYSGSNELDKIFQEQLEKIKRSRERAKLTKPLPKPLAGFHRTPEEIEKIKQQLRKPGYVQFHPSGFGTGYTITTKRCSYSQTAPELSKFFGVTVYVETFDAD